jgi:hypothetical protein
MIANSDEHRRIDDITSSQNIFGQNTFALTDLETLRMLLAGDVGMKGAIKSSRCVPEMWPQVYRAQENRVPLPGMQDSPESILY